jgi:hypothetical protein
VKQILRAALKKSGQVLIVLCCIFPHIFGD